MIKNPIATSELLRDTINVEHADLETNSREVLGTHKASCSLEEILSFKTFVTVFLFFKEN